ncbi:uncharacterized protein LOC142339586 isoform X2 [Convolutriloba macropyga]|uniref:uncharacterized protein LOC142339586 isoform X2 n=1 Tax=Convolutriloba macropyga TaxID=536237 RepID=UPI003F522E6A
MLLIDDKTIELHHGYLLYNWYQLLSLQQPNSNLDAVAKIANISILFIFTFLLLCTTTTVRTRRITFDGTRESMSPILQYHHNLQRASLVSRFLLQRGRNDGPDCTKVMGDLEQSKDTIEEAQKERAMKGEDTWNKISCSDNRQCESMCSVLRYLPVPNDWNCNIGGTCVQKFCECACQ